MKHLLLDFGGVVLKTPYELRDDASKTLGPVSWAGPFDPSSDPEYVRWQSGEITEREYWHDRAASYGLTTRKLMDHFFEPPGDRLLHMEMWDLIRERHAAGGVVGCLTNDMAAFQNASWIKAMTVISEFDFIVDGSITGFLKPHPKTYELALEALGNPNPADVVFVDDQRVNLNGAIDAGITTVFFDPTDLPDSMKRVRSALAA
jgi:putative hydrolase of the HAD superfamily